MTTLELVPDPDDPRVASFVAHLEETADTIDEWSDWARSLKGILNGADLAGTHASIRRIAAALGELTALLESAMNEWIHSNREEINPAGQAAVTIDGTRYRTATVGGASKDRSLKKAAKTEIAKAAFERLAPWIIERAGADDTPDDETALAVRLTLSLAMAQLLEAFTFDPASKILARTGNDTDGVPWQINVNKYMTPVEARTMPRPSFMIEP